MNRENLIKLVIGGAVALLIIIGSLFAYNHHKIIVEEQQKAIESQVIAQKQLADNILRSQASYASKSDIEAFAKQHALDLDVVRKDLAKLQATPTSITSTVVRGTGTAIVKAPTTKGTANPNPPAPTIVNGKETYQDPYGYLRNTQIINLYESFGTLQVPLGQASFSSWRENPWDYSITPREYKVLSVIGTDNQNRNVVYNKFTISANGVDYPVQISSSETKQEYPMPAFSWLNPRLFIGFDTGYSVSQRVFDYSPNLSLAISSYGKFLSAPDFSLFHIGVGYSGASNLPQFTFTPAMYNIGKHLPFMSNSYIGPSFGMDIHNNYSAFFGLKVSL
jgi:hypothetical protein